MSTTISLVMTVYNRQHYLPQSLDSILAQTYVDWHLTLWDDGSTDASPEIAREYAKRDSRIEFIPAPHTGRIQALHDAIQVSAHPYLAFVDSDDLLAPNALAATVEILDTQPNVGMVYSDHIIIDGENQERGLGFRCKIPYSPERMLVDFMTFHFRLLRREVYDRVGGIDRDFHSAEDYDLCLKISEVTEIYHLAEPLYYYREHANSISQATIGQQTEYSGKAVRNALVRRGLADRYQLNINKKGEFSISKHEDIAAPISAPEQVEPIDAKSMQMVYIAPSSERGVIYCATSHFLYLEAALISALTLRKYEPDLPIKIVSDCQQLKFMIPKRYQIEAQFYKFPADIAKSAPAFASRSIKTQLWKFTDFDETLFIDADILPLRSLTPIWDYLTQGNVSMALDRQPTIADCDHISQGEREYTMSVYPGETPQFNSGVILWRKSAESQCVFRVWEKEWHRFRQHDQLALARAIQMVKPNIVKLPETYNFSVCDLTPELKHLDPRLYLLHCWGGLVKKGHFQEIAKQIDPEITEVVSKILTPIFVRKYRSKA